MTNQVQLEIRIPGDTSQGHRVQEQLVSLMKQFSYSLRDIFSMQLLLEESLINAIRHGNKGNPGKSVTVNCQIDERRIRVVVTDEGDGFEPESVPDPTQAEFIDRPCGRGLRLLRAYLDVCEYSDGGRRLTMERERNSPLPCVEK